MDVSRCFPARDDVVRFGLVPEQPLVAAAMVCDRSRRRLDCVFGVAPESHGCADDLLATTSAARVWRYHVFRYLFLPWKCRCVFEPSLAIERRLGYPGIHEPIPSGHARAMDNRFYFNDCRSAGEYVAHGPASRTRVAGCDRAVFWTG